MKDLRLDWCLKWLSTILVLMSVMFRIAGPEYRMYDLAVGSLGTIGWLFVSVLWKDRALIILNSVMFIMLGSTFLKEY